jgi:hypothetical protein
MPKKKKINTKKFEIARRQEVNVDSLLPVIQNLTGQGFNLSDVGMLLGYAGDKPDRWLYNLRQKYPEINDAITIGRQAANAELIRTAFQEATGYWIEEEEVLAENIPHFPAPDVPFGEPKPMQDKYINKEKKTKRKFIQPNTQLLFKLLCCRLPEFFSDVRKVEIDKRSLELKGTISDEIKSFAGALYRAINTDDLNNSTKGVEPHEVEAVFEPSTVLPNGDKTHQDDVGSPNEEIKV